MFILANHSCTNIENNTNNNNVGICNLIKTLYTSYKINKEVSNTEICVHSNIKHIFELIFNNSEYVYINSSNNTILDCDVGSLERIINVNKNNNSIYQIFGWRLFNLYKLNIPIFSNNPLFQDDLNNSIDFKYTNIPSYIQTEYINVINRFTINDKILKNVSIFLKKMNNEAFTGVHIRTWKTFGSLKDNRSDINRYNYFILNRHKFIEYINNTPYKNIFIATDNLYEIKFIVENIQNKNIFFYEYNDELHNMQNTFSEILILSRASELIGSSISTFTEMAWWHSKCNNNIKIV